jgi:glycosyltransferase involved in cell wall biosynthesis
MQKVEIYVSVLNHEKYIQDLLHSIWREFGRRCKILLVDLGSTDNTFGSINSFLSRVDLSIEIHRFPPGTTNLEALSFVITKFSGSHFIGMSGDDVLGTGYGESFFEILGENGCDYVINFRLVHTDSSLNPIREQRPRWSTNRSFQRIQLSLSNPGTGPGTIYPVKILKEHVDWTVASKTLIEDYYVYWSVIDYVKFVNSKKSYVLYRRHDEALSTRLNFNQYVFSIGFSVGVANAKARNTFEKMLNFLLYLRWSRHVSFTKYRWFLKGFRAGKI